MVYMCIFQWPTNPYGNNGHECRRWFESCDNDGYAADGSTVATDAVNTERWSTNDRSISKSPAFAQCGHVIYNWDAGNDAGKDAGISTTVGWTISSVSFNPSKPTTSCTAGFTATDRTSTTVSIRQSAVPSTTL